MSSTTGVGSTGTTGTTGTGGAATTSGTTAGSDAFQKALAGSMVEARTISTTNLGSMVAKAQTGTRSPAISRPVVATSAAAGATNSVAPGSSSSSKVKVPDELRAYGNGRIPADALALIGIKKHRLWNVAAEAFKTMRADAAAAGVDIGVTDSYRDYDEQVDLVRRKGLYSQGGLAAVPGTSQHGWGMALDVDVTPAGLAWMRENASKYGWVEAVPREPWHWEYHGTSA